MGRRQEVGGAGLVWLAAAVAVQAWRYGWEGVGSLGHARSYPLGKLESRLGSLKP